MCRVERTTAALPLDPSVRFRVWICLDDRPHSSSVAAQTAHFELIAPCAAEVAALHRRGTTPGLELGAVGATAVEVAAGLATVAGLVTVVDLVAEPGQSVGIGSFAVGDPTVADAAGSVLVDEPAADDHVQALADRRRLI